MIKLETHCHTFGTSSCADTENKTIINKYLKAGYKGIIATNHFSPDTYDSYMKGETHREKIDCFFSAYEEFKSECEKVGIRVFFGAEIRVKDDRVKGYGTEYTVIGFDRKVFYDNAPLFALSQEELFNLAKSEGAFMYQTHPFRTNVLAGNPKYLHGAEAFNGHYHHANNNDLARVFYRENNLIGMSGTDFHHKDQPITAGMYLPEEITDEKKLVDYIFANNFTRIEEEQVYLTALKKYKGE